MGFDPQKPFRTRDGQEALIYREDGCGSYAFVGAYRTTHGWRAGEWSRDGRWVNGTCDHTLDLVNLPARFKHDVYINVYSDRLGAFAFRTREDADRANNNPIVPRTACIKVVVEGEEGEFDT